MKGLKIAIFEDDKDVAELLIEMMETRGFQGASYYNIKDSEWTTCDLVLGDYRNKIVPFKTVATECLKKGLPLIAISGDETEYPLQIIKPFTIDDLQALILETLTKSKNKLALLPEAQVNESFFMPFKKSS